jgi:hypothetical protein
MEMKVKVEWVYNLSITNVKDFHTNCVFNEEHNIWIRFGGYSLILDWYVSSAIFRQTLN